MLHDVTEVSGCFCFTSIHQVSGGPPSVFGFECRCHVKTCLTTQTSHFVMEPRFGQSPNKTVGVIRNIWLGRTAKSLFASLDCTDVNLCSALFSLRLHSSAVGSWCVIKHVSSQITVRDDRPLALSLACLNRIWLKP